MDIEHKKPFNYGEHADTLLDDEIRRALQEADREGSLTVEISTDALRRTMKRRQEADEELRKHVRVPQTANELRRKHEMRGDF